MCVRVKGQVVQLQFMFEILWSCILSFFNVDNGSQKIQPRDSEILVHAQEMITTGGLHVALLNTPTHYRSRNFVTCFPGVRCEPE